MEIERKFLVDTKVLFTTLDANNAKLKDYKAINVNEAYLSNNIPEVRVRKETRLFSAKYKMAVKSNGDELRKEVQFTIPASRYNEIITNHMYNGIIISKKRVLIPIGDGFISELDIYGNELAGLVTVEVEFKSKNRAEYFERPIWFGKEVTEDLKYKNRNLSISQEGLQLIDYPKISSMFSNDIVFTADDMYEILCR